MRVIGIDPGFANVGWAIGELGGGTESIVKVGCIQTKPSVKKKRIRASEDNLERGIAVARELRLVILEWKPKIILAEGPGGAQGFKAAFGLGAGTGLVASLVAWTDLPIRQVTPQELKVALTGKADASKDDIADAVTERFPSAAEFIRKSYPKARHEHPFDAIAVIIACLDADVVKVLRQVAA